MKTHNKIKDVLYIYVFYMLSFLFYYCKIIQRDIYILNKMKKNDFFKKSSSNMKEKINIEDYFTAIANKCEKVMPQIKNKLKFDDSNIVMPNINNYYEITKYNYNVQQLKIFAKKYNLKISGNKKELTTRLFTFLHLSSYIIKIQKNYRGHLQRKYNFIQGPGSKNRNLCTNNTDFITMEDLNNLNQHQFFSYMDDDGFIYGFDIASIYNVIFKNGIVKNGNKTCGGQNPYNRIFFSDTVIKKIKIFIRLSKLLKFEFNLEIEDELSNIPNGKIIELRALKLFQEINALGNYSDASWFLSLNRYQLVKFIRELVDIWQYRAQLSLSVKRNICPPIGDPFRNLSFSYISNEPDLNNVKKVLLEVLEKLVFLGIDNDSKSLGAYYVLGALTIVNESAATALPWLFQSVN